MIPWPDTKRLKMFDLEKTELSRPKRNLLDTPDVRLRPEAIHNNRHLKAIARAHSLSHAI